jgi:cyclic beta-1,2-glucan synthetase
LPPAYVSTVDSGNLAGHLIALKQGLLALGRTPLLDARTVAGLRGAVSAIEEAGRPAASGVTPALAGLLQEPPTTRSAWPGWLDDLRAAVDGVAAAVPENRPARAQADQVRLAIDAVQADIDAFLPWLTRWPPPAGVDLTDESWLELTVLLEAASTLVDLAALPPACAPVVTRVRAVATGPAVDWLDGLLTALQDGAAAAAEALAEAGRLADAADAFARAMDFRLLYDGQRDLFAIGYRVADGRLDNSAYDLLASEARLASFVAIAKGDVPLEHWFRLNRPLTRTDDGRMLLSWSGTMFEYLMPLLIMRRFPATLLDETYAVVVRRHISYGRQRGVPWGISEAAYAVFDLELTYQYRAFGVPGTGLRRGLSEDLVVAPYASVLAGPVEPRAVLANVDRLARLGMTGRYGLYESIDYTATRQPDGRHGIIVRTYMAHHQGMILVALANWLGDDVMVERFHAEPATRAVELLLQERLPRQAPIVQPHQTEVAVVEEPVEPGQAVRHFTTPQSPAPRIHLLSNGEYSIMITNAGAGSSHWRDLAITRWREDTTRDHWGFFIYVRDLIEGQLWSTGYQPTTSPPDRYDVTFAIGKAEIRRRDHDIETYMEVAVSPEDDVEVRRVSLLNLGQRPRELAVFSYAEVALATPAADRAHPAFSKLFVETERVPDRDALLASRRPRAADDERVWALHALALAGETAGVTTWETDRARFLGRGRTPAAPAAVVDGGGLSGTVGAVLDPVFSLRRHVRLAPGASVTLSWALGAANSRAGALALAEKYTDPRSAERAVAMAWTYDQIELHHLNLTAADAHRYLRLAARLLYIEPTLRPAADVLARNRGTQAGLWRYGVSGDLPIVLVQVLDAEELGLLHEVLRAHEYWRRNGMQVDVVVLNEDRGGYQQALHERIQALVQGSTTPGLLGARGGISLVRGDMMSEDDRVLFMTVARAVLVGSRGDLERQLAVAPSLLTLPPRLVPRREPMPDPPGGLEPLDSVLNNGLGGFTADGREYVIDLPPGVVTPAPWVNVIASPVAGCVVSEAGPVCTWAGNSRENRLTPWSNDPVSDGSGEALYLRDEETGAVWSATPRPCGADRPYRVRHGQGYTVFEHLSHGVQLELTVFVPPDDPVRLWRLRLTNRSGRSRRLSATAFVELVLGVNRDQSAPFVVTEVDRATGALLARNAYNNEFADRIAFAAVNRRDRTLTADRLEFIGRNGSLGRPAGLGRIALSGRVGAGLDPCAALQAPLDLLPEAQAEVVFLLGQATDRAGVASLIARYDAAGAVTAALATTTANWDAVLGAVQVRTPEPAWDMLLNRWLLYQTLGCRVWARSAFYQSGGAYGFRDQLQDSMALTRAAPAVARAHLLRAAARQFVEGDVQHWWHPPTGRGVRTRFSDDLLWLPYVVHHYVETTGDRAVLHEIVPFIEGETLAPGQEDAYFEPRLSSETGTLYEHCCRAIERGLTAGPHGLPLMGAGDWNDGMNRVGIDGRGESVWVAWFLTALLPDFAGLCAAEGDAERAARYRQAADRLRQAVETHAWDGGWYRRAYFDDGTPLGSVENDECRIDAIAQAWAVISGAGDPARSRQAMAAVGEHLVREDDGLILLLTPPFDQGALDPGYIKGYVPGVRENGGQYTHAALWTVLAYALLGDGTTAGRLYSLLNPIRHAAGPADLARYVVEPYVVAADVYAVPPHTGRGGWTWYTGSAGWMYRVGLEALLGLRWRGDRFTVDPCVPASWRDYTLTLRHGQARYDVTVQNPHGLERGSPRITVDGADQPDGWVTAVDDGATHAVTVVLEPDPAAATGR